MTVGKQWAIQGGVTRMYCPTFESLKTTGEQLDPCSLQAKLTTDISQEPLPRCRQTAPWCGWLPDSSGLSTKLAPQLYRLHKPNLNENCRNLLGNHQLQLPLLRLALRWVMKTGAGCQCNLSFDPFALNFTTLPRPILT